jgi:hypothetical protein
MSSLPAICVNLWLKNIFNRKISVIGGQKSAEICGSKFVLQEHFQTFLGRLGVIVRHLASFGHAFLSIFLPKEGFFPLFLTLLNPPS